MISIQLIIEELEKRYPNKVSYIKELSYDEIKIYIAKLEMIEEFKKLAGVKDEL